MFEVLTGDVLDVLSKLPPASVDAVLTDPPYGLSEHKMADIVAMLTAWLAGEPYQHGKPGFMGRSWDSMVPGPECWREVLRVLRPGGHALVFAAPRTLDLMIISLRLAGFEIRDCIRTLKGQDHYPAWVYGSGFPKSLDVGKALDKAAGAEREVVGRTAHPDGHHRNQVEREAGVHDGGHRRNGIGLPVTAPATAEAAVWEGYGSALKPAWEPVIVARKPMDGTVAQNVTKHGVGGLNIGGCQVPFQSKFDEDEAKTKNQHGKFGSGPMSNAVYGKFTKDRQDYSAAGRLPANVIHDGSDEVLAEFAAFGKRSSHDGADRGGKRRGSKTDAVYGEFAHATLPSGRGDAGIAARFFYAAKASAGDRWFFCRSCGAAHPKRERAAHQHGRDGADHIVQHPTVKPTSLTEYLARLALPPAGIGRPRRIIVPFAGTGSEVVGALRAGWGEVIGIDQDAEYAAIAEARCQHEAKRIMQAIPATPTMPDLFGATE